MNSQQPLTTDQLDQFRKRLSAPDISTQEAREIALRLLDDNDKWYAQADRWRESYRIAAGLTDDELNARMVIEEATRRHPRPCQFPDSPECVCESEAK